MRLVDFICDKHGFVISGPANARAYCAKCKGREVPPKGKTMAEHNDALKNGRKT